MEIVNASVEIIPQEDIFKHIEKCGRICYKSEKNITDDSAKKFIQRICKSGHTSVLEHGSVYIKSSNSSDETFQKIFNNKFTDHISDHLDECITNMRVLFENDIDLFNSIINGDYKEKYPQLQIKLSNIKDRVTVKIVCDRRIETECVRHRVDSFSIESTRYVNYKKRGLCFIEMSHHFKNKLSNIFLWLSRQICSLSYKAMIKLGEKPEIARNVLLSNSKAEIAMTASVKNWQEFFKLRCASAAHPQMREIADEIKEKINSYVNS